MKQSVIGKIREDKRFGSKLVGELEERVKIGIARYGEELMTFNGRDALKDLREEILDGFMYATQIGMERPEIDGRVHCVLKCLSKCLDVCDDIERNLHADT